MRSLHIDYEAGGGGARLNKKHNSFSRTSGNDSNNSVYVCCHTNLNKKAT